MYYTGIGSRKTPKDILDLMEVIGEVLGKCGYTLRSGGADGADSAFERGCDSVNGNKEIFLPWPNFNNNTSNLCHPSPESYEYVKIYHPAYNKLKRGGLKLHARNTHQVLGKDLNTSSKIVITWADSNQSGTQQALRIAKAFNIPIFNLFNDRDKKDIKERIERFI